MKKETILYNPFDKVISTISKEIESNVKLIDEKKEKLMNSFVFENSWQSQTIFILSVRSNVLKEFIEMLQNKKYSHSLNDRVQYYLENNIRNFVYNRDLMNSTNTLSNLQNIWELNAKKGAIKFILDTLEDDIDEFKNGVTVTINRWNI